ncbi:MAG: Lrp/AsnC ligand binding domain-containing protein [Candidatus Asgardarchaeia archaeon]
MTRRKKTKKQPAMIGFVFIKIEPVSRIKPAYDYIKKNENIVEMHEVTGEFDILCKVTANTPDNFRETLDYIRQAIGVKKIDVMISYHQIKPEPTV